MSFTYSVNDQNACILIRFPHRIYADAGGMILPLVRAHTISQELSRDNPEQKDIYSQAEPVQVFRHFLYDFWG